MGFPARFPLPRQLLPLTRSSRLPPNRYLSLSPSAFSPSASTPSLAAAPPPTAPSSSSAPQSSPSLPSSASHPAPSPPDGFAPSIANSVFLKRSKEEVLRYAGSGGAGWKWRGDEAKKGVGEDREVQKMNMCQAVRDAMSVTLASDPTALVFGEDVAFGGVFRATLSLSSQYGAARVFNTPLTEQGIVGFGIGLAEMGQTAVAEIQFVDYLGPAFDQLTNEAARLRYRSNDNFDCGRLTVRAPCGAVGHGGLYHSQSPEAYYNHAPGLKIVIPRSPTQAKGLLLASIRDPNPVLFFEPKILYRSSVEIVPTGDYEIPLGKAEVLQEGKDLTIVTYGTPVYSCEAALSLLSNPTPSIAPLIPQSVRSTSVELIDLRTISPWDVETVCNSVKKTGRLIIVHEATKTGGVGGEIGQEVMERCFLNMQAPVKRVTGWDLPSIPYVYEKLFVPDQIRILDAIIETMDY